MHYKHEDQAIARPVEENMEVEADSVSEDEYDYEKMELRQCGDEGGSFTGEVNEDLYENV